MFMRNQEIVMVSRNDNYSFTNEWYEIAFRGSFLDAMEIFCF